MVSSIYMASVLVISSLWHPVLSAATSGSLFLGPPSGQGGWITQRHTLQCSGKKSLYQIKYILTNATR